MEDSGGGCLRRLTGRRERHHQQPPVLHGEIDHPERPARHHLPGRPIDPDHLLPGPPGALARPNERQSQRRSGSVLHPAVQLHLRHHHPARRLHQEHPVLVDQRDPVLQQQRPTDRSRGIVQLVIPEQIVGRRIQGEEPPWAHHEDRRPARHRPHRRTGRAAVAPPAHHQGRQGADVQVRREHVRHLRPRGDRRSCHQDKECQPSPTPLERVPQDDSRPSTIRRTRHRLNSVPATHATSTGISDAQRTVRTEAVASRAAPGKPHAEAPIDGATPPQPRTSRCGVTPGESRRGQAIGSL